MGNPTLHRRLIGRDGQRSRWLEDGRPKAFELLRRCRMWAHRCMTINSDTAAAVPFKLYRQPASTQARDDLARTIGRRITKADAAYIRGDCEVSPGRAVKAALRVDIEDLVEIRTHPVLDMFQDINDWSDGHSYRFGVYYDLQAVGHSYTHIVPQDDGDIELWRLPPHQTTPVRDPNEFVSGFDVHVADGELFIKADEVLWLRLFDPRDEWGGYSPTEAWIKTIDAAHHIEDFRHDLFERGGSPDWMLKNAAMNDKQKRAFRADWRKLFERLFRRKETVAILDGEGELERISDSPRDLDFVKGTDQVRDMIAAAYGTPKAFLTSDDVNRANAREASNVFMRHTIWPYIQRVEDGWNEQLVQKFGDGDLLIVHDNPIREDETIRIQDRKSKLESGWAVNEVRAEDGAEALSDPNADVPLVASGLSTLERVANPPDPVAPMPVDGNQGDQETDDDDESDGDTGANGPDRGQGGPASGDGVDTEGQRAAQDIEAKAETTADRNDRRDGHAALILKANPPEDPGHDDEIDKRFIAALLAAFGDYAKTILGRIRKRGSEIAPPPIDLVVLPDEVEEMILRMRTEVRPHIARGFQAKAEQAIADLEVEISFDMNNTRVLDFLSDSTRRIGRQVTDTFRREIRNELIEGVSNGESTGQLAKRVETATGGVRLGHRAERIARTEMAFAHTAGTIEGWRQSGVVKGKQWVLAPDPCPWCKAVANVFGNGRGALKDSTTLPLGRPFYALGDVLRRDGGGEMTFDYTAISGPPLHPNCRCSLRPVLEGDDA